jgi:hypothetical protein
MSLAKKICVVADPRDGVKCPPDRICDNCRNYKKIKNNIPNYRVFEYEKPKKEVLFFTHNTEECPFCHSTNIEFGEMEISDGQLSYEFTCNRCKLSSKEWHNLNFIKSEGEYTNPKQLLSFLKFFAFLLQP